MVQVIDVPLVVKESAGPFTLLNRLLCKLVEALPQKFGTPPTEVNVQGLSAPFGDGRNSGIGLEVIYIFPAIPLGTESR